MIKRFITALYASLLLTTGGALATASASAPVDPNPILCGLKVGASLDVTHASDCNQTSPTGPASNHQNNSSVPSTGSPATSITGAYVALGDSVAAGLGLSASTDACGRSYLAYPNLVASQLGLPLTSYACSGATAGDLFTQQHVSGPNPVAQLDAAFASGTPSLITITAGANDVHWADFIKACYSTDCTGSGYTAAAHAYLTMLQFKLQYALWSVQSRAASGVAPRVIMTGYYNPLSLACSQLQPSITPAEVSWIEQQTTALNHVILSSTRGYSFARYAPVSFAGHDLCSGDPWVQGITAAAPLHPTAQGQQAIAQSVLNTLRY